MIIISENTFSEYSKIDIDAKYKDFMTINFWDINIKKGQFVGHRNVDNRITKCVFLYPKTEGDHEEMLVFYVELSNGRFGECIYTEKNIPYVGLINPSSLTAHPLNDNARLPRIKFVKGSTLKGTITEGIQFTNDDRGIVMWNSVVKRESDKHCGKKIELWVDYVKKEWDIFNNRVEYEFQKISTH